MPIPSTRNSPRGQPRARATIMGPNSRSPSAPDPAEPGSPAQGPCLSAAYRAASRACPQPCRSHGSSAQPPTGAPWPTGWPNGGALGGGMVGVSRLLCSRSVGAAVLGFGGWRGRGGMAAAGRSRESQRSSRRVVEYRGSKDRCAASGSPGAPLVLRGGFVLRISVVPETRGAG